MLFSPACRIWSPIQLRRLVESLYLQEEVRLLVVRWSWQLEHAHVRGDVKGFSLMASKGRCVLSFHAYACLHVHVARVHGTRNSCGAIMMCSEHTCNRDGRHHRVQEVASQCPAMRCWPSPLLSAQACPKAVSENAVNSSLPERCRRLLESLARVCPCYLCTVWIAPNL